jgi:hypothetical protein
MKSPLTKKRIPPSIGANASHYHGRETTLRMNLMQILIAALHLCDTPAAVPVSDQERMSFSSFSWRPVSEPWLPLMIRA